MRAAISHDDFPAVLALRRRDGRCFVPHLSYFGLYLFMLLWEAGQRYQINYLGIYLICAAFGLQMLFEKRETIAEGKTSLAEPDRAVE